MLATLPDKLIFPIHPRTQQVVQALEIMIPHNVLLIPPVNYLDMTILERNCKYIITDSGGVQPEAWFLGKKCIIMRRETEWIDAIEAHNNILYDYQTPLPLFVENFLNLDSNPMPAQSSAAQCILNRIISI